MPTRGAAISIGIKPTSDFRLVHFMPAELVRTPANAGHSRADGCGNLRRPRRVKRLRLVEFPAQWGGTKMAHRMFFVEQRICVFGDTPRCGGAMNAWQAAIRRASAD